MTSFPFYRCSPQEPLFKYITEENGSILAIVMSLKSFKSLQVTAPQSLCNLSSQVTLRSPLQGVESKHPEPPDLLKEVSFSHTCINIWNTAPPL